MTRRVAGLLELSRPASWCLDDSRKAPDLLTVTFASVTCQIDSSRLLRLRCPFLLTYCQAPDWLPEVVMRGPDDG
jgi:hypothetical protein